MSGYAVGVWAFLAPIAGHIRSAGGQGLHSTLSPVFRGRLCHLYWVLPGIVDRLVRAGYRVIATDMRGHGFSQVVGPEKGYDVETIASDFGVLADHLGLQRFHLLSHATGGMAAIRYAVRHSDRLLSLMSTDTGSATDPTDWACDITDPEYIFERRNRAGPRMEKSMRGQTWPALHARARARAGGRLP